MPFCYSALDFTLYFTILLINRVSKKMLQDEILKIGEYFRGIEYYGKAIMVKVAFPPKWQVFPSKDGLIKPAKNEDGIYYYYGSNEEVTIDDIFNVIEETIELNKDTENKIQFLVQKRKELDELFKTTPFEKLTRLRFVFDEEEKPKKPKRKYTRKKKTEENTDTIVTEEKAEETES